MSARRWLRHVSGMARARLRGDAAAALRHRRELALLALDADAETLTFRRDGLAWTVRAVRHTITRNLYVHGRHPGRELDALADWLRARGRLGDAHPWCVDVGANVGAPTLFFARDLGRRVVAIEPVPANFALLRTNVDANALGGRIVCVNAAVAETEGTLTMALHEKDGQCEVAGEGGRTTFATTPAARVDVPARPLDALVADAGAAPHAVAFAWSDTQGFEAQVVRSGGALWAAGTPLFCELWPEALELHGGVDAFADACARHFGAFALRKDLESAGARVALQPIAHLRETLRALPRQTDGLLVPSD